MRQVKEFFDDLVTQYGVDPRSTNWSGAKSQQTRFAVFCAHIDLSHCSILDVGCGQADFYAYLRTHRIPFSSYQGWDVSPKMIAIANGRFPELGDRLLERDLFSAPGDVASCDWVICSGSLNYSYDQSSFEAAIRTMYGLASKGLAFNVLSTYADFVDKDYYYAEPERTFTFCHTLSPWVNLIHSYMPHDFIGILGERLAVVLDMAQGKGAVTS